MDGIARRRPNSASFILFLSSESSPFGAFVKNPLFDYEAACAADYFAHFEVFDKVCTTTFGAVVDPLCSLPKSLTSIEAHLVHTRQGLDDGAGSARPVTKRHIRCLSSAQEEAPLYLKLSLKAGPIMYICGPSPGRFDCSSVS